MNRFKQSAVRIRIYTLLICVILCSPALANGQVTITQGEGKATVMIDGDLFTEYLYEGHPKPILYPIIGPHGIEMTRHYPMKEGVDNEAPDHPHHESLWFTHDEVNGINFWSAHPLSRREGPHARVAQKSIEVKDNTIRTQNDWLDPDENVVCSDRRVVSFGSTSVGRYIDFEIAIHASHGDVTFADTKEGTMAIRTHPLLRLAADPKRGNHTAAGHAINSEGDEDRDLWGKRAKWVDYWGPVNERLVGIAIFDHPSNPRHPTWWHARHYGLVAANPFGIHDFENKEKGTGDMLIESGTSVTFRYRFLFHEGDAKAANIEQQYASFATD